MTDKHSVAKRVFVALLVTSCILLALHILLKYISVIVYGEQHLAFFELSNRFDMNDENSVPQWFTLMNFLAIATMSFFASFLAISKAQKRLWMAIGVLALLLSIDDAAAIHESLLGLMHLSAFDETPATLMKNAWLFLVPVVVLVGLWLLWHAVRLLPRRTTLFLGIGGVVFLVGAMVIDSFANTVPERSFAGQGIVAGIEGWVQMIGLALLVFAIFDYLERQHGAAIGAALKRLKD